MDRQRIKRGRWIALGTLLGVVAAWGGIGLASGAPSSITTCTKTSSGKTKVIAASAAAKCTKKGKGTVTVWDPHATTVSLQNQLAAKQRYDDLLKGSVSCGGTTDNFSGMELQSRYLPHCMLGANLSNADLSNAKPAATTNLVFANLSNADLSGIVLFNAHISNANLSGADLTGASLEGAIISSSDFSGANLTGADLSSANAFDADFTGANVAGVVWDHTGCPDGTYTHTNGSSPQSCAGHGGGL